MISYTNELCFKCKNAYGGCAWSKKFDPVEGWVAEEVENKYRSEKDPNMKKKSWHILACPQFEKG